MTRLMTDDQRIEVGRVAHELESRLGTKAYIQAARYAERAAAEGNEDEAEFWRWVEASLTPRAPS